jgi:hypothetical protein
MGKSQCGKSEWGNQNAENIVKNGMGKSQCGKSEWGNQNAENIDKNGMRNSQSLKIFITFIV